MRIASYPEVVLATDLLRHSPRLAVVLGVARALPVGGVVFLLLAEVPVVAVPQHQVALDGFPKVSTTGKS